MIVSSPTSPAAPCPVACGSTCRPVRAAYRTTSAMPWMDRGAAASAGCWDPLELCGVVARAYPAEPGQAYSTSGDGTGSVRWLRVIIFP